MGNEAKINSEQLITQANRKSVDEFLREKFEWYLAAEDLEHVLPNTKLRREETGYQHSYIKANDGATLRITHGHQIGKGTSGNVKGSKENMGQNSRETLVKTILIPPPNSVDHLKGLSFDDKIEKIKKEAAVAYNLGIAVTPSVTLIERKDGSYKAYLRLFNLGDNLKKVIESERNFQLSGTELREREISRAIKICHLFDQLHNGHYALDGESYVHRDIKPENLTEDKDGKVHIIDVATAKKRTADGRSPLVGTPAYAPLDAITLIDGADNIQNPIHAGIQALSSKNGGVFCDAQGNVLDQLQENMAILKTLRHPNEELGIEGTISVLSESTYESLPESLKGVIDAMEVKSHLSLTHVENATFYSAVLATYQKNNYTISQKEIDNLRDMFCKPLSQKQPLFQTQTEPQKSDLAPRNLEIKEQPLTSSLHGPKVRNNPLNLLFGVLSYLRAHSMFNNSNVQPGKEKGKTCPHDVSRLGRQINAC